MLIKGTLRGLRQFLATENPLRIIKNAFYFTLKAVSIINTFKFCSEFFDDVRNRLIRKLKLISNFMTSQTGKQIITVYILPHISRDKVNQGMKFGQLIEHNMRNIFLEESCRKCGRETSPRLFFKKNKNRYKSVLIA